MKTLDVAKLSHRKMIDDITERMQREQMARWAFLGLVCPLALTCAWLEGGALGLLCVLALSASATTTTLRIIEGNRMLGQIKANYGETER